MIGQETEYRRTYASEIPRNILGFKKEHFVNLFTVEKYQKYGIFFGTVSNSQASTPIFV